MPSVDEIEEDTSFIGDVLAYMNSPEGELFLEVGEIVSVLLEQAGVDAEERQIIWDNGERLSIAASAQRIGVEHPEYPLDIIEQNVVIWLESEFAPPTYTPEQFDNSIDSPKPGFRTTSGKRREPKNGQELATLEF